MRSLLPIAVICALATASELVAQQASPARIHWYLEQQLDEAAPGDQLPIYVVLADRLRWDHWFPRVHRLRLDARRALVVAELKAHAARTQADLLAQLDRHRAQGRVRDVAANWLGNFVRCTGTAAAIRDIARLDGIDEVRYAAAWPRAAVEDGSDAAPLGNAVPGDGPINTHAHEVWQLGFDGSGVVVMNADSGINIAHGDLRNRLWTNPGEIPGNGVDDDQNGHIDDVHGWNFFNHNNDIDDGGGHGTHTAGTLVGDGTCSGTITGQAPGALVMTAALGPATPQSGPFTPAGEVAQWDAIQYAIEMGAHVQTSSYSYKNSFVPPPDYQMHREVGDNSLAAGLIRTNSTGNNGSLAGSAQSLDRVPFNVSTPGNLPPPYLDPAQQLVGRKSGVVGVGAHNVATNQLESYSPHGPFAWHIEDVLAVNPAYPLANWQPWMDDYPWFQGAQQGLLKPDITGPTATRTTTGAGSSCALFSQTGTSNATPRVAGTMVLWKDANMSLGPEDMAMIAHQSAAPHGTAAKKNTWGVGRVHALQGLLLALCTHRVNGEPAWRVDHPVATEVSFELDTVPNAVAVLAIGTRRSDGGPLGLGGQVAAIWSGRADGRGDASLRVPVHPSLVGLSVFTQYFVDDLRGATQRILSSNVIETRFVP